MYIMAYILDNFHDFVALLRLTISTTVVLIYNSIITSLYMLTNILDNSHDIVTL